MAKCSGNKEEHMMIGKDDPFFDDGKPVDWSQYTKEQLAKNFPGLFGHLTEEKSQEGYHEKKSET